MRWEYCKIVWLKAQVENGDFPSDFKGAIVSDPVHDVSAAVVGHIYYPNRRDTTTNLLKTIARLGDDGWEMVSHSFSREKAGDTEILYFKRLVQ
jgi:hypothetical protein